MRNITFQMMSREFQILRREIFQILRREIFQIPMNFPKLLAFSFYFLNIVCQLIEHTYFFYLVYMTLLFRSISYLGSCYYELCFTHTKNDFLEFIKLLYSAMSCLAIFLIVPKTVIVVLGKQITNLWLFSVNKSSALSNNDENYTFCSSKDQTSETTSTIHTGDTFDHADRCLCCPMHRIEMEQLNTIICTLQSTVSENLKILLRKQNILTNIVTDAVGEIHSISEGVQKIKVAETQDGGYEESVFNLFPFPIDTMEKFKKAEDFWSEESNFKASVHELSKIGGNSIYEFIKRVMSLVITNNLASTFTWFGTKSKESLEKSKLAEVLLRAADLSNITCNKKMAEEGARKYLRRAKERSVSENRLLNH